MVHQGTSIEVSPSDAIAGVNYEQRDDRYQALEYGLLQLRPDDLLRLHEHVSGGGRLVLDEVHYDPDNQLWCPLAVGLDVPRIVREDGIDPATISEQRAKEVICAVGRDAVSGFTLNPIGSRSGTFYTRNRRTDINQLISRLTAANGS